MPRCFPSDMMTTTMVEKLTPLLHWGGPSPQHFAKENSRFWQRHLINGLDLTLRRCFHKVSSSRPQAQAPVESELHLKNPSSWISFRFFKWLGHKLFQLPRVTLRNTSRKKEKLYIEYVESITYLWKPSCPSVVYKFYCYSKTNSDTFFFSLGKP